MDSALDIEAIIRRARLRSSREPKEVIVPILYQTLKSRGHNASLHYQLIKDEGRSTKQALFLIEYNGDLWSVDGKGDLKRQLMLALARQSQTWKNPVYADIPEHTRMGVASAIANERFSLQDKIRARIEAAVSHAEAELLGRGTDRPEATRKSPRL